MATFTITRRWTVDADDMESAHIHLDASLGIDEFVDDVERE